MSPPSGNTRVEEILAESLSQQIPALAVLYDRWANALDPDTPGIDEAEKAFHQMLSRMFDFVVHSRAEEVKGLALRDFRVPRCFRWNRCREGIPNVQALMTN